MAQPKRRWSKARTGLRRSTWKHRVCPSCGYYDGKKVISTETAEN